MKINISDDRTDCEVGKLAYGAVVTGVSSNPDCVYIKVDKKKPGVGIELKVHKGHSLLLNLKTGGLRAVQGDLRVIVLDTSLEGERTHRVAQYIKHSYLVNQDGSLNY